MHRHLENDIFIVNKATVPHTQYRQCDMFIPREAIAAVHLGTVMFKRGADRNRRRIATTAVKLAAGTEFLAHENVLDKVNNFK